MLSVNLLSNIVKEHCEQLTTWPLRKEHSVLQQPNLTNNLAQTNLFRHKKGKKLTKKQGKNPEVRKAEML
jgi:hypothetical protein